MTGLYIDCLHCDFEKLLKDKGYSYFKKGNFNLNIIGIRSKESVKNENRFDDVLIVIYYLDNKIYKKLYNITTDPGITYLKKPLATNGCAILVPGQYKSSWTIGLHKGKYKALVQCKPVKVYRDNNKDDIMDFNPVTIDTGMFGINIHKAGENSTIINNWSAGCQVFQRTCDFNNFMYYCDQQTKNGFGNKFTYTLLEEKDLLNYIY